MISLLHFGHVCFVGLSIMSATWHHSRVGHVERSMEGFRTSTHLRVDGRLSMARWNYREVGCSTPAYWRLDAPTEIVELEGCAGPLS